jgi:predicted dienelactone hydrolase
MRDVGSLGESEARKETVPRSKPRAAIARTPVGSDPPAVTVHPFATVTFVRQLALTFLACVSATQAPGQVGFRQFQLPAAPQARALDIAVWYPTAAAGAPTLVGDNAVFTGQSVHADAAVATGRHPLVVLSHGYNGNWISLSWLAVDLARLGWVVAAMNHPGTTTGNMDARVGAALWERPRDVSRTIDALTRAGPWAASVASDRIAAIGHSLGGWTVVELGGGRFDPDRLDADCAAHGSLASCQFYKQLEAGRDALSRAALARDLKDPRVKAVVSLDLGLARSFDPGSLARVGIPVLVIAAGAPDSLIPAALESRYMAGLLPQATTHAIEIAGAAHFSFLPVCKPGAGALLARESPDDAAVCRDGEGVGREAIHRQVAAEVIQFLNRTVPPGR